MFFGDPETMMLSQFAFRLHERFTYEYNFFDAWLLDIRFESEHALDPKRQYPRCVAGARRAPLEDSGGARKPWSRPEEWQVGKRRSLLDEAVRRVAERQASSEYLKINSDTESV